MGEQLTIQIKTPPKNLHSGIQTHEPPRECERLFTGVIL
jgi:hypothetical protein